MGIVIATSTRYEAGDPAAELRAKMALRTFTSAFDLGYRVFAVDSGSDEGWLSVAKQTGVVLLEEDVLAVGVHSMGRSRRQAISEAMNCGNPKVVVYIDPEKYPFVEGGALEQSALDTIANDSYASIPRRKDNLKSYPPGQSAVEIMSNQIYKQIFEENGFQIPYLDMQMGTKSIGAKGVPYFLNYPGKIGREEHDRWESIFVPVWQMILEGKKVTSVDVDYIHPKEQTLFEQDNIEFSAKRAEQTAILIGACINTVDSYKSILLK